MNGFVMISNEQKVAKSGKANHGWENINCCLPSFVTKFVTNS